jgi:hypothetical protein
MKFRIEKKRVLIIVRLLRMLTKKLLTARNLDPGDEPERKERHGDIV